MQTNQDLLDLKFDIQLGDTISSIQPDNLSDEDLRDDWEQAQFYLRRILRRLYQTGEFNHVGT